ncbi:unnamed protein product [Caenorhabditis angaria]|uniref:Uncharacterized protein n=1 Tax=Caenorhabditis angaria TaxID=860376 RepID=A0A9P1IEA9_9PELO|nr:unnamed protein product [Caenorhabditis angaria]
MKFPIFLLFSISDAYLGGIFRPGRLTVPFATVPSTVTSTTVPVTIEQIFEQPIRTRESGQLANSMRIG